jgi:hypothetical protein
MGYDIRVENTTLSIIVLEQNPNFALNNVKKS